MAVAGATAPRGGLRSRDPEGRMSLGSHLKELRNRFFVAVIAITAGTVAGWFLFDPVYDQLTRPLREVREESGRQATLNFGDITTGFNNHLLLAVAIGFVLSSPVWMYQAWAFVVPGLTRKERWYAFGFLAAAVPLFLAGVALGWVVFPNAVKVLIEFAPENESTSSILQVNTYLSFVTRLLLATGLAFLTPVVMVALSMVGLVSSRTWLKGWRLATVGCFLFAAIASPTPDVISMFVLAIPMVILYLVAALITLAVDRRRARRLAALEADGQLGTDDDLMPYQAEPLSALLGEDHGNDHGEDGVSHRVDDGGHGSDQRARRSVAAAADPGVSDFT